MYVVASSTELRIFWFDFINTVVSDWYVSFKYSLYIHIIVWLRLAKPLKLILDLNTRRLHNYSITMVVVWNLLEKAEDFGLSNPSMIIIVNNIL